MNNEMIKVTRRQKVSGDCFVCGINNPHGFKAQFYELENDSLITLVKSDFFYQSYPGRMHGGLSATLLDEVMGRTMLMRDENVWGVTTDMQVRYLKPVPLGETLRVIGRITKYRHLCDVEGEILAEDGTVVVSATARYMRLTLGAIAGDAHAQEVLFDHPPTSELTAVTVSGKLCTEYDGNE